MIYCTEAHFINNLDFSEGQNYMRRGLSAIIVPKWDGIIWRPVYESKPVEADFNRVK